jgi:hypothetical protein
MHIRLHLKDFYVLVFRAYAIVLSKQLPDRIRFFFLCEIEIMGRDSILKKYLFAGTKKMEYKTRQWHEKCFCCCVCKVPIGTQSFIPREQEIYCAKCYEEKFATRCIKCNKVST